MNKKQFIIAVFLLYLIFMLSSTIAQTKIHKHLTTEDGLISNRIVCMMEDTKGYIWFGTDKGASKWDGIKFINYSKKDGLASSHIEDIKEGKDGKIYLATYGKGLTIIDNDSIYIKNEANGLVSNWVTTILVRKNGEVIIGAEKGKISVIRNGKIFNWQEETGFRNSSVKALFEKDNSTILLGSHKLFMYEQNKLSEYSHSTSDSIFITNRIIYAIEEDSKGNILVGTNGGIFQLKRNSLEKIIINQHGDSYPSGVIKSATDGTIYFGSEHGVLIKSSNKFKFLTKKNGLSDNIVWSILEDSNGTLYFGTRDHGVNIYNPGKIETFIPEILSNKNVSAVYKDSLNNFYFGTNNGVIIKKYNSIGTNSLLKGKRINLIFPTKEKILIGTETGLELFISDKFIDYLPFSDPGGFNNVWAITKHFDEGLFIGFQGGLYQLIENKLNKINSIRGHNQFIQDILLTSDSSLVIGTHGNGINIYKNENHKLFNTNNGLSDNIVNSLYETKDRVLLIGTDQGGLDIIENSTVVKNINISNGLSSNTIVDIHEHKSGNIYLSTSKGLNMLVNWRDSLFIRTLLSKDGLVSNSCNRNATFLDEEGILWVGTNNGVTKYNPNYDKPITSPPKIYLTDLEIFNKKYPIDEILLSGELNHDQNYLKFIYTGINLSAPKKILYKYHLAGIDKDWVESQENNVQYTSLDDGNYTFEVKARNEWGYWSQPASIAFTINPAWWETWWFRLAIITFISSLLWLAFQYRLNYLLKVERLRTKIASDLHDDVGSLLTQISINADSLNYTRDTKKIKEKSGFIVNKSGEVINLMRDVIWSIDSRNDTLESLVDRIHNFASEFLSQKDISLEFDNQITNLKKNLKIIFRQNIMMIAKEAINNSVKYSECDKVKINLKYNDKKFEMIISDNGKGIDFENVKMGNGLKNMKMRADKIDAEIEFRNGDGMSVHLIKKKI